MAGTQQILWDEWTSMFLLVMAPFSCVLSPSSENHLLEPPYVKTLVLLGCGARSFCLPPPDLSISTWALPNMHP